LRGGWVAATKQEGVQSAEDEAAESLGLRYGDKVPLAGHRRKHQKGRPEHVTIVGPRLPFPAEPVGKS